MLRLIGILTGSAIAVAFLILALGVPDFSAPEQEPQVTSDFADEQVTEELVELALDSLPDPIPMADAEPAPEPVETPTPAATPDPDPETEALIEQIFNPGPEGVVDENWYAFWSPFRSEIAANGFVSKLQESTGLDYRVVKVETGVYEVAFAYIDDADIQDKLARISNATGMNMTDS